MRRLVAVTVLSGGIVGASCSTLLAAPCRHGCPPVGTVNIATNALPRGTVGAAYPSQKILVWVGAIHGLVSPGRDFVYSATGLPSGLSFAGSTIVGTPSLAGSFNVSIRVDYLDARGRLVATGTRTLSLVVSPAAIALPINGGANPTSFEPGARASVQQFMGSRANLITAAGGFGGARALQRLGGGTAPALADGGGSASDGPSGLGGPREPHAATAGVAPSPLGGNDDGDAGAGRFSLAASLSQLRSAGRTDSGDRMGLGSDAAGSLPVKPPAVDVWVDGTWLQFDRQYATKAHTGHAGVMALGVDYLLTPGLLVGAFAQFDSTEENDTVHQQLRADGRGWMVGPYLGVRLTETVFADARLGWGKVSNTISPFGFYTDSFESTRLQASARLTGQWQYDALTLRPSAEVVYYTEKQAAYTSVIDLPMEANRIALGRLSFGPEVAYRFQGENGDFVEPFAGIRGVWDFASVGVTTPGGGALPIEGVRGRVEAGGTLGNAAGLLLRASGAYDGIGDAHYRAYEGRATLVVPLR